MISKNETKGKKEKKKNKGGSEENYDCFELLQVGENVFVAVCLMLYDRITT